MTHAGPVKQAMGLVAEGREAAAKHPLAKVVKTEPSERDGLARTVTPAALPKNVLRKTENHVAAKCEPKPAAAQDLAFLAAARGVGKRFAKFGTEDTDDYYGLEAATPLDDEVTDPDGVLDG